MDDASISAADVVVAVVNHRSASYLASCVASLDAAGLRHLVIVDNSEDPVQVELIEQILESYSGFSVLRQTTNQGFGAAINIALEIISSQHLGSGSPRTIVWTLNPDCTVRPDALRSIGKTVKSLATAEQWLASPTVEYMDSRQRANGERLWFAGGLIDCVAVRTEHFTTSPPNELTKVGFLSGCSIFGPLRTWRELGGYPEHLFLYWEDAYLSRRASLRDIPLYVCSYMIVRHAVGGSGDQSTGASADFYYYMQRNRVRFAHEFGLSLHNLSALQESLRWVAIPLVRERDQRWRKTRASLSGLVAGFGRR